MKSFCLEPNLTIFHAVNFQLDNPSKPPEMSHDQGMVAIMMNYNHKHVFSLVTCKNEVNHDNKFYFQITKVEYD